MGQKSGPVAPPALQIRIWHASNDDLGRFAYLSASLTIINIMKSLLALFFATTYGFILRYCFAFFGNYMEVISLSLVALSPLIIGFFTIVLSGLKRIDDDGTTAFFRPWLVTFILLLLTIAVEMEGAICWIIIYPFFSVAAGIGGLIGLYWLRRRDKQSGKDNNSNILDDFDSKNTLKLSPLLVMPLLLGAIENDFFLSTDRYEISVSRVIDAPAEKVWAALTTIDRMPPGTQQDFFGATLGLPKHLATQVDTLAVGGRRKAIFEKGLFFEETIVECIPNERLRVHIKSDPGSIPPNVLDEHVAIGGKHFKALEDTYQLTPMPDGRCHLQLSGKVELNTPFNRYAWIWTRWLMSNFFDNLLNTITLRTQNNQ
jgi:hypothetical protein